MLSETSQTGKNKYCITSLICRIFKKAKYTHKTEIDLLIQRTHRWFSEGGK